VQRDGVTGGGELFAVIICTRDRPGLLKASLAALARQTDRDFPVWIVSQGRPPDPEVGSDEPNGPRVHVIHDPGRGISHARNVGWRSVEATWLVYLDDDCVPDPDWAEQLRGELLANADVDLVSGQVTELGAPDGDYLSVTTLAIDRPHRLAGRWTRPWRVGFGACMAVRRDAIERLGGWDERLGAGNLDFPGADDMDFNWRLMQAGGVAYLSPGPRVLHDQWRAGKSLPAHFRGYTRGWCGFATKQIRTGDVIGGLYLLGAQSRGILRLLWSAITRRSVLRLRIVGAQALGFVEGTVRGLARRW
jgi:GT2 family glycosyltransferase